MTKKKKINVMIDGRNFTVVGGENENYIRNLAYYVDEKITNLASKNDRLSQTMAATLAALNIADEYHKTTEQLKELENKAKDPLEKYSGLLNELKQAKSKNEELEKKCKDYKEEVGLKELDNIKLEKALRETKELLDKNKVELEEAKRTILQLQDKNFDSQIELVDTKKQLTELLKLLDEETNMFKERNKNSEK